MLELTRHLQRQFACQPGRGGLFEIGAQQLLPAAHDTELEGGGGVGADDEVFADAGCVELVLEGVARGIVAYASEQCAHGAQACDIEGHVGGAAGVVLGVFDVDYGDGGFRGDAAGGAVPVAVEHDVADDQNVHVLKGWELEMRQLGWAVAVWPDGITGVGC